MKTCSIPILFAAVIAFAAPAFAATGGFAERETKLKNYISVSAREGEFADAANGMIELGNLYADNGYTDKAIESYKNAYNSSVRNIEDMRGGGELDAEYEAELEDIAATAAGLAGPAFNALGMHDDALRWLGFAEEHASHGGDQGCIAQIYNNRGAVFDSIGNYRDALKNYFAALEKSGGNAASTCDKALILSSALNNIGLLYLSQGNTEKAATFLARALESDAASGDPRRQAVTKNNLCLNAAASGDFSSAENCYPEAAALYTAAGDSDGAALARINLSDTLLSENKAAAALDELKNILAPSLSLPANLRAAALHNLAAAELRLNLPQDALKHITEALALKENQADLDFASLALNGEILHALGKTSEAKKAFESAINLIEKRRVLSAGSKEEQARAFSRMAHVYREMILLLLEADDVEGALHFYELMKARTIREIIRGEKPAWDKMLSPEEAAKKKELEIKIATFNRRAGITASLLAAATGPDEQRGARAELLETKKQNDEAVNEYTLFMDNVFSSHPELAAKTGNYKPSDIKTVRAALAPDEIVACFIPADDSLTVFLVSSSGVKFIRVPVENNSMRKSFDALARWKKNPESPAGFDTGMAKLSTLLLEPIAAAIAPYKKLIVIPDSYLWEIPFQALKSGDKYLVETHDVEYALSLESLLHRGKASPEAGGIVAFGDAVYLGECAGGKCTRGGAAWDVEKAAEWKRGDLSRFGLLSRIPGTGEEVGNIKSIYADSSVFLGADASERNFMSHYKGAGILHLATHGIYNSRDPMGSSIALSQIGLAEDEDGFLQAREIFQMDISARLVVLSACESARSENLEGEGITGLVWSFFSAGAGSVIASQWYVSDYSTALTMKKFYEELKSGETPSAALRKAQLFVIGYKEQNLSAPFYWAPFIFIGVN